jgi:hypothetical protein
VIEQPTANGKPALDENSFTRLLAAAYVMQEHQDRLRTKVSPTDLTEIIAQVVDTQHEIQTGAYRGAAALALIAKRLCSLTAASGVAIGVLNSDKLLYRAGIGTAAAMKGSEVSTRDSLAAVCLKAGTAFQSPLAQTDPRLNSAQCRKLGVQSLLAIPLYHDGKVAGALELYFSQVSSFADTEIRAAELMGGVASEVIADGAEQELREELESERTSVLQAIEMLQPELQKMAEGATEDIGTPANGNAASDLCRACGHAFVGNESSCGVCGASRATGMYPGAALQSKWAVLWERHLSGAEQNGMPLFRKTPARQTFLPAKELPEPLARELDWPQQASEERIADEPHFDNSALNREDDEASGTESQSEAAIVIAPWPSVEPHESSNLDQPGALKESGWNLWLHKLRQRPGDSCLALASVLLLITLLWALWPRVEPTSLANANPPSISAIKRRPRPKPPKLSLFEQALVGLGLAVPPPTPEYKGDPTVKVWEDLQTALYYCPDADLYGNTAKGRYTSQGEAQQDAFEPALRKPCD